jgi:site-specific recombinase XerD
MHKKTQKSNHSKVSINQLKGNIQNEKIKRKYFNYLNESQGLSEKTITSIEKALHRYEDFIDFEDFSKFNQRKASEYKKWLENKTNSQTGQPIAIGTVHNYLRSLQDFFKWLCYQPAYKTKICKTDVDYLKLSKEKTRMAVQSKRERFPTIEQVTKVVESIQIKNEINLRDRALISFTLLSGMTDSAIISLPIECFNTEKLEISQDPKKGVRTKFKKTFKSYLFPFNEDMLIHILDWVIYLRKNKLFGNSDPLFPRSKTEIAENSKVFISNSVEPYYWQEAGSIRKIFKQRFNETGIEYFSPHTFRHLAVNLALSKCKNGHEVKAVSQNFGHENVGTTMITYGSLNNNQLSETIKGIDFFNSEESTKDEFELFKQFQLFQKKSNSRNFLTKQVF